ncbi:MAG: aminotransferase class V-fold PLP-dependent enzyme [Saprospiraceae bacterium]|nr:aminotransferase class V-fold PLP-dependent enzyme [Saprospiraceae bacterium]
MKTSEYSKHIEYWTLDRNITFLNHGSFGATPLKIMAKQNYYRELMENEPVDFFVNKMPELLNESKGKLAKFIGVDNNDIVFVQNTTTGVNQILTSFPYKSGDEWLVTSHAYGACMNAIKHFAHRNNIVLKIADIPFPVKNDEEILNAIGQMISSKTKLALIDHITSATGMIFPIKEVIDLLHDHGIKVLVDGAHAPGMVDLDIIGLDADIYVGNCHKWMCAPKGSAFMHVKKEFKEFIKPLVISHFNDTDINGDSYWSNQFMWDGTHDFSQYICVGDTIQFMNSLQPGGWKGIMDHNHKLAWQGANLIAQRLNIELPLEEKFIGSMVNIPMPDGEEGFPKFNETSPLKKVLFEKYKIEVPVFFFPSAPTQWLRISAQLYNSLEQYEYLGECLESLK